MRMSRRNFLATMASSAALAPGSKLASREPSLAAKMWPGRDSVLMLDTGTPLRESLAGYEAALSDGDIPFIRASVTRGALPSTRAVIVPACITLPSDIADRLASQAGAGSLVLLESGAGFASPAEFEAHRDFLRAHFRIAVLPPLDLWEGDESRSRIPYVDYQWPHAAKIRDFSRITRLAGPGEHAIAHVDGHVVASKQRLGRGTLLFLGSPLGPVLWAGDAEAHRWFRTLLATS